MNFINMEWFTREAILVLILGSVFAFSLTYTFEYFIKHTDKLQLQKNTKRYLRLPIFYRFAGFFLILLVPIVLLGDSYFTFQKNGIFSFPDPNLCLVSFVLFLIGTLLILYCKNYKIILEQDAILSRGIFRKHKRILWRDIQSVQFEKSAFFLSDSKEEIEVVTLLSGFEVFIETLEKYLPQKIAEEALEKYENFLKK
ncbi:hypothetical protein EHQ52_19940 [Leptospira koniambonensis]|uniref:Uncharacterized protein n=1 Tax=Leptospira koniambonensis TaxID=2484950 RepID=A0A4R9J2Z2_9LEPT|nr:hypothetical protein [Leptospira koniambonensis]TGL28533.1 hypothetical protein EHQ52_19940 [Leptospira koniambonensis]